MLGEFRTQVMTPSEQVTELEIALLVLCYPFPLSTRFPQAQVVLVPWQQIFTPQQAAALTITAEKYMLVTPYIMIKIRASDRLLKQ